MINSDILVMKLQDLGLFTFAKSLKEKISDPKFQDINPWEVLEMALDDEIGLRTEKLTEHLLERAKLKHSHACVEEIEYRPELQLDRELLDRLAVCTFARNHRNICLYRASGTGKSFIGKAPGVPACNEGFRKLYVRFANLMRELTRLEKADSKKYEARLNFYGRIPVLIIDEWRADAKKWDTPQFSLISWKFGIQ